MKDSTRKILHTAVRDPITYALALAIVLTIAYGATGIEALDCAVELLLAAMAFSLAARRCAWDGTPYSRWSRIFNLVLGILWLLFAIQDWL